MGEAGEFKTIPEIFLTRMEAGLDRVQFRHKENGRWVEQLGEDILSQVREIALGLHELGVRKGDRAAILAATIPEWCAADVGILCLGGVTVGIYHTYLPDMVEYILKHSDSNVIFVEDEELLEKVLEVIPKLDPAPTPVIFRPLKEQSDVLTLSALQEKGAAIHKAQPKLFRELVDGVVPDDLATIIYTSGTTGPPKGAMCTHGNLYAAINNSMTRLTIGPEDVCLVFLPLAHALQRQVIYAGFLGQGVGAWAESLEKVLENFQEVRPTVQPSVPRIWEKFYTRIQQKVSEAPRRRQFLANIAFSVARKRARRKMAGRRVPLRLELGYRFFDKLVYQKFREVLGGRVRYFISGGAPIAYEILEFFYSMGMPIYEGWGLTETSAPATINGPNEVKLGSVGLPLPGNELQIAEDGEILVKGPSIFVGYHKNPEATADVLSKDGWFKTGDVGHIDEDGYLFITDRKKDLIITAGGVNIAPQNIENLMKNSPLISQACVIGDKRKYLVALVTLDEEELQIIAETRRLPGKGVTDWVKNPAIKTMVEDVIKDVNTRVASYSTIKKFELLEHDFSIENGELTPTLKVKRRVVQEHYGDLIEGMYRS